MRTLRAKFILTFLVLTLVPAIAMALLIQDLLDRTLSIGVNTEVAAGLGAAMQAVQKIHAQEREQLSRELHKFAAAWHAQDAGSFHLREVGHVLAIVDSAGALRRIVPRDGRISYTLPPALAVLSTDTLLDAGSDSTAIRLVLPVQPGTFAVGQRTLAPALRGEIAAILRAAQYFNVIDLEKTRLQRSLWLVFLAVYVPMLALAGVAGWYLARRITAPLEALAAGTRRLAQGDWQHRVTISGRDEIGEMGQAFNAMVNDLQQQQEKLIGLEKLAAWREMARVLAHEIKNPLTPMQLMVQQMRDEYRGEDQHYRKMLGDCGDIINEEIEKLRQLAREFSDFARMPELHPASGQLNDLIRDVARLHATRTLKLDLDSSLPQIQFDWDALRRVLVNLIENAFQSSAEAEVTIRTRAAVSQDTIELMVSDTGPGIPAENLKKIFEPYFSTKKSGMGLGLAIVKRIIEEHQGSITAASQLGIGTQFFISLPVPIT